MSSMMARFGLVALAASAATADNYAVLICGSNEYENYRHHADIAHAYQLLTKGGYKAENIITMMYNDVASDPENPFPGQLYNKPAATMEEANEVYGAVKDHIDYEAQDVTAANFLAVLTGDSAAANGKKVLTSGAEDNVFVYFADHGGAGIICTPDEGYPCSGMVHAADLQQAFETMQSNKMYKQLVFYLEACESGSMFENILPTDMNIYAVSASNADESSWGSYCPGDPVSPTVGNTTFDTCLGDLFSTNFMENDDVTALTGETLQRQYKAVKKLTTKSPVMQWGDLSIADEDASAFEGTGAVNPSNAAPSASSSGLVDSRDIKLSTYYRQYMSAKDAKTRAARAAKLNAEIQHREEADARFAAIAARLSLSENLEAAMALPPQPTCWKAAHEAVSKYCGAYSDYSLKHARVVVAACNLRDDAAAIEAALKDVCATY